MTNALATKARFIQCPKCLQLLQESADIPIYRCGGCDLILQASHRNNDSDIITGANLQKSEELQHKESNNTSGNKDPSCLNHDKQIPSLFEHSVEFNDPGDQITSVDSEHFLLKEDVYMCENGDQLGDHGRSKAEDNAERDEESTGTRLWTEFDYHDNDGSSRIDKGNSEREASKGSSPVPEDNFTREEVTKITALVSSGVHSVEEPKENITVPNAPFSTVTREERLKRTSHRSHRAYDRRMSEATTTGTEYINPVSDFSSTLTEPPRSPHRILRRYCDDLSSHDDPEMHCLDHSGEQANSTITRERFGEKKHRMKYDSEIRYPEINTRPTLSSSHEDDFIRAGGRVCSGMVGPPSQGTERRYRRRYDRSELPMRIPENCRHLRLYYDSRRPSNQIPGYSRFSSGIRSNDVPTYPEQEKTKLLRMVYELEYQLKRTCNLEGMLSERMHAGSHWREKHGNFYCSHDRMDKEGYLRGGPPVYSGIDERDNRWGRLSRYPKRPFSAEMAERSRHHNNSYHHPFDWRRSEPFPPPAAGRKRSIYGIRNEKSFYSPYNSCPSSSQHSMFSPYGYESRSDNEIYGKAKEYEKYREGYQPTKMHVRPAAGGAPWIICSICSRLLQLPTDFLLFKRRYHRLRCGSCLTVLMFSVRNRKQLLPFVRHTEVPPPSEADDQGETLHGNNQPLGYRGNDFVQEEVVSYSDDIGISCSTEGNPPARLAMLHSARDPMDELLGAEGGPMQKSGSLPLHQLIGERSIYGTMDVTSSVHKRL